MGWGPMQQKTVYVLLGNRVADQKRDRSQWQQDCRSQDTFGKTEIRVRLATGWQRKLGHMWQQGGREDRHHVATGWQKI